MIVRNETARNATQNERLDYVCDPEPETAGERGTGLPPRLQLLIVTPLQKIHVIEPYVSAVGFVDNPTSCYSRLQTLTIDEYHAKGLAHVLGQRTA